MKDKNEIGHSLVALGLGSNKGDSVLIINTAVETLKQGLKETRMASLYDTDPLYVIDQGNFINTAITGFYEGTPRELLYYISYVEAKFGRDRVMEKRWGERLLDIDILLFDNFIIKEHDLVIPHSHMKERRFALEPLLELLPDIIDPESGQSFWNICQALPDQGVRRLPHKPAVLPE